MLQVKEGQELFESLSSKELENAQKELRIDVSRDNTYYFHVFVIFRGNEIRPSVIHRVSYMFRSILRQPVLLSLPPLPVKYSYVHTQAK